MRVLVFIVFSFLIAGCEKSGENSSDSLISKWTETDHYYSIGGPIEWHPTEAPNAETIEFKNDNIFYSSLNNKLNRYQIITEGTTTPKLKLYEEGKTDTTYWFISQVTQNSLTVGISGCIEGCGKKFTRVEGD